mmetsp:Transcript_57680/g.137210  ORF Transcript_57680/g.137210 Transcript_57680/m.137210 type:complete len:226 (+) Transcript_57680:61-738(+)
MASSSAATAEPGNAENDVAANWKTPYWQPPVKQDQLALHDDGPLAFATKSGYLQKRAGKSRLRWNIRWFELREGQLRWWRPDFTEQVKQPSQPRVAKTPDGAKPKPVRSLDLRQLKSITRTKVRFPYSTRIKLVFNEAYTSYELELRAEVEVSILEWFKVLSRFTMERFDAADGESTTAAGASGSVIPQAKAASLASESSADEDAIVDDDPDSPGRKPQDDRACV